MTDENGPEVADCFAALHALKDCLVMLDRCNAPFDIGAQIDLAISRLETHLSVPQDGERNH